MNNKFSFSQYTCFQGCPRRYWFQYVRGLVPKETARALAIGVAFHEGLSGQIPDDLSLWHQIGLLARRKWPLQKTSKCEVRQTVDLGLSASLVVIADEVTDEHVIEYKTVSRPDSDWLTGMMLSNQLRLYCMVFSKPSALLRVCKKSEIRPRKSETEKQFEDRYYHEYLEKPDEFFLEIEVPIANDLKVGTIKEFYQVFNMIQSCYMQGQWPSSAPFACSSPGRVCAYLPLCSDEEANLIRYQKKEEA